MILKDWSQLGAIIGQIDGMATAIEWSEDVDPKKIREGLLNIKGKLETVFESERQKLEDVNYKIEKPKATPNKKKGATKK